MKQIMYILTLLSVTLLSSCEVEEGQSGYPKTLQGKIIYDGVQNNITQSIYLLDLMTKVDYYAQATANEKEGIKNYFLPRYTITSTDRTWTLKDSYQEIVFSHNQKSINENGAVWTIKMTANLQDKQSIIIEDQNFRVTSAGDKDWRLTTNNLKADNIFSNYSFYDDNKSSSELVIKGSKAYEKSPNLYDFKIESGNGNINFNSSPISYTLLQPMSYTYLSSSYSILNPINGKLDITKDKDKISALITTSNYYTQIEITFNGVTETY